MTELLHDLRLAVRGLRRRPMFASIVIITLALGIGGNTAILIAAHSILFTNLPFPHSEELVRIQATTTGPNGTQDAFNLRGSEIEALWQQGDQSPFSALVAGAGQSRTVTDGDKADLLRVSGVYGDWSSVFAIKPILGRWFSIEEQQRGDQSGAVVISASLWKRRYSADRAILGRSISLDHHNLVIVGVMPDGFHFPYLADAWTPVTMLTRSVDDYAVFGRLKQGVSITAAKDALAAVSATLARQYPNLYSVGVGFRIQSIRDSLAGEHDRPALTLAATAIFFLLLASFNVASLLIARSASKRSEIQLRAALGASRWQLIRASLSETLVYSLAGGFAGLAVAAEISPFIDEVIPAVLRRELAITGRDNLLLSVVLAVVLSVFTAFIAGLLPAVASATTTAENVRPSRLRSGRSRQERFWMDCFVTVEFVIALALIAGAALMLRNFSLLTHRDLGIDTAHLLAMHVSTTDTRYHSAEARERLVDEVVRDAEAAPGVAAAGICTVNPLGGGTWTAPIAVEGYELLDRDASAVVNHRLVTPRLFEAMGIHLLKGRLFTLADGPSAPRVAIVSQRMAQKYWPEQSAIGKRVRSNRPGQPWMVVVGVVSDVNDSTDPFGPRETWYLPYSQHAATPAAADVVLMVRSIADPRGVEKAVEQSVQASNNDLALFDTASLDAYYLDTLSQQRLSSFLIAVLAAFGLLLGALGIYGTLAFSVSERVQEIGIRMALGSGRPQIVALIMRQGLRLSLIAAVFGLAAAWGMGQLLRSQLSEVRPADPGVILGSAALLLLVASIAIYAPAHRAAQLDPMAALRSE